MPAHDRHRLVLGGYRGGLGPGGVGVTSICPTLPHLPSPTIPSSLPLLFLLQMEPHLEEVPVTLGPDLLTVRKSGVSRTHSLPNDSYMCRDGNSAEGSLGHRGWGLPKAQSGTRTGTGQLGSHRETQTYLSPGLALGAIRQQKRSLLSLGNPQPKGEHLVPSLKGITSPKGSDGEEV
jgi:hypothetical protein